MSWPQPYEGITGTGRDDGLLSLEDAALPRRAAFTNLAECLYRAVLVGQPAPVVIQIWQRISRPVPGDLVLEQSTQYRRDEDTQVKRLGVLLARRTEWASSDADWQAEVAERPEQYRDAYAAQRPTEDSWYIQYGPAAVDVCRWANCSFLVVPTDRFWRA